MIRYVSEAYGVLYSYEDGSVEIYFVKKLCKKYQAGKAGATLGRLQLHLLPLQLRGYRVGVSDTGSPLALSKKNWLWEGSRVSNILEMDSLLKQRQRFH